MLYNLWLDSYIRAAGLLLISYHVWYVSAYVYFLPITPGVAFMVPLLVQTN